MCVDFFTSDFQKKVLASALSLSLIFTPTLAVAYDSDSPLSEVETQEIQTNKDGAVISTKSSSSSAMYTVGATLLGIGGGFFLGASNYENTYSDPKQYSQKDVNEKSDNLKSIGSGFLVGGLVFLLIGAGQSSSEKKTSGLAAGVIGKTPAIMLTQHF